MKRLAILFALAILAAATLSGHAAEQAPVPGSAPSTHVLDPAMATRLKRLESELRCLVCQNQTLADSAAGLAQDLRNQVEELALEGKSDEEIKTWLQERYGDFVLYRPPVRASTWLLWFGPGLLLLIGLAFWAMRLRFTRRTELDGAPAEDLEAIIAAVSGGPGARIPLPPADRR